MLHHKLGYCCRILSFTVVDASFALFHLEHYAFERKEDRPQLNSVVTIDRSVHNDKYDILITYILLIGAVVLEVIAFYMLLFCDWTVIKLRPLSDTNHNTNSWKDKFINCILLVNNARSVVLQWFLYLVGDIDHHTKSNFADSRWANSLSTFNLIHYCLHRFSEGRENLYRYFGLLSFLHGDWYVKPQPLTDHIPEFIFEELKTKSKMANNLAVANKVKDG